MNNGMTILLTATINPGNTIMMMRKDPVERMNDYEKALCEWVRVSHVATIVFCENSGADLTNLKRAVSPDAASRVEFLSVSGAEAGSAKGKGYCELGTIDLAIQNSSFIDKSDVIVKCTGRLSLENTIRVIEQIRCSSFDVMCTLRNYLSFADSRIFAATKEFYAQYLMPLREIVDDSKEVYFEHALAAAVGGALRGRKRWRPFPVLPRWQGISGTHGRSITESAATYARRALYHRISLAVYKR